MRTLPEALRAARSKAGLRTDREFAEYLDVERSTLSRWLNGQSAPRPAEIPRLAPLVGLSVEQLEVLVARARRPGSGPMEERVSALEEGVVEMRSQLREILDRLTVEGPRR